MPASKDAAGDQPAATVSKFEQAVAKVATWLTHFIDPDQVVELRALEVETPGRSPCVWSGPFRGDELESLARHALELSGSARGVYYTLNPLHEKRFVNQAPRTRPSDFATLTHDVDVRARCWLVFDFDPVRAPGFADDSTTEAEKALAWDRLVAVRTWLSERGWPDPIISDSGNGYHLLYRLAEDLPSSGKVGDGDPIRLALVALAHRFDDDRVKIDRKLYNPSRILKFPGTLTRKGPGTPERPHRRAIPKDMPSPLGRVAWPLVQKLADEAPAAVVTPSIPETAERMPLPLPTGDDPKSQARRYMARLPGAVAGQRGHDRTYQAARLLVNDFGLDEPDACDVLHEWNLTCTPPWDARDIDRKVSEASRKPFENRGWRVRESYCQLIENVLASDDSRPPDSPPPAGQAVANGPAVAGVRVNVAGGPIRNSRSEDVPDGESTKRVMRGRPCPDIVREILERTGGWPKRSGGKLFVEDAPGRVRWLETMNAVFGWLQMTFAGVLPGVEWAKEGPTRADLFEALLASHEVEEFASVQLFPHEPLVPDVYYSHPRPISGSGKALQGLLNEFCPATPDDEDLLRSLAMTFLWGGPPGARPAFMITSTGDDAGRGTGKTTVVELLAELVGGCISTRQDEQISDLITRILSNDGQRSRVVLLDNLKSLRFSSSAMEALVTSRKISGKVLYMGNGTTPNLLTIVLTANAGSLSRDLADRVVTIQLTRPAYQVGWESRVRSYIETHRWEIIGDLILEIRSEGKAVDRPTRWAEWCGGVLSKVTNPQRVVDMIRVRSGDLNEDEAEAETIRSAIVAAVEHELQCPGRGEHKKVWFTSADFGDLIMKVTHEKTTPARACRSAAGLGIKGLKESRTNKNRGWVWCGELGDGNSEPVKIKLKYSGEQYSLVDEFSGII